jgi:hypothetical protein
MDWRAAMEDRPLSNSQMEILRVASHSAQISQSRLAASPSTLSTLIKRGYLEQIKVPFSEPYYRITAAGLALLQSDNEQKGKP